MNAASFFPEDISHCSSLDSETSSDRICAFPLPESTSSGLACPPGSDLAAQLLNSATEKLNLLNHDLSLTQRLETSVKEDLIGLVKQLTVLRAQSNNLKVAPLETLLDKLDKYAYFTASRTFMGSSPAIARFCNMSQLLLRTTASPATVNVE
jgi:hypothetical protein